MQAPPISRRSFIKKSGVVATATLAPLPSFAFSGKPKYKMGLQLFTIRDAMAKDPYAALKKVAAHGYQDLETCGYDGDRYYGYSSADFKSILDDLELTATSGRYGFSDYFKRSDGDISIFVDQCIVGAKSLSKKYITWPLLAPEYRTIEQFKRLVDTLNKMGEQFTSAGLGFAYHNHDFEFTDYHGEIGMICY